MCFGGIPESRSVRFPGCAKSAAEWAIGITESVRAPALVALDDREKILREDLQALEGLCWSGGDVIQCLLPTNYTLSINLLCPLVNPVFS